MSYFVTFQHNLLTEMHLVQRFSKGRIPSQYKKLSYRLENRASASCFRFVKHSLIR